VIDLRSDTITRPSDAMRQAMASAEVGDDVYRDDPTVNRLEEELAGILGKDDAMYVPTGTMSNQVALRVHTEPGDVVITAVDAHIGNHELGGPAHHSGVTLKTAETKHGAFTADALRSVVPRPHPSLPSHLFEPHPLVCFENTHNAAGGTVWDLDILRDVSTAATDLGLQRHMDGARLWNASAASGVDVAAYATLVDTVSVCFSKGLGAPVGSALAGPSDFISEARRFKHMFGGGFRQAGMIAAGAQYALDNNRDRLVDDHENARAFAEAIANTSEGSIDLDAVHTNIVFFNTENPESVVDSAHAQGVAMLVDDGQIRAVFHLDVSVADTTKAIDIVTALIDRQ
jgi:threonine aldolase